MKFTDWWLNENSTYYYKDLLLDNGKIEWGFSIRLNKDEFVLRTFSGLSYKYFKIDKKFDTLEKAKEYAEKIIKLYVFA